MTEHLPIPKHLRLDVSELGLARQERVARIAANFLREMDKHSVREYTLAVFMLAYRMSEVSGFKFQDAISVAQNMHKFAEECNLPSSIPLKSLDPYLAKRITTERNG